MTNDELIQRDLRALWHPCTQMKDHEWLPLIPIKSGKGVWLEDYDGHRYLDAISSWWTNLFGHANPYINDAVADQLANLEHVLLGGFTHEPVISLSERLIEITPPGLAKCFFADNGSSAVEVALKMSFHYWLNNGKTQKTKFVTLSNSYHGETLGALAVGDVSLYKSTYRPLLLETITVPSPDCYWREPGVSEETHSREMFALMRRCLEQNADQTAAVIVEPLVQCAGSMRMYHPVYLSLLREACDELDIHLIADEIAVGFGRTGTLFACEQAKVTPDFLCLSKGLTGGYLPLACVVTTQNIYDAFYDDYSTQRAFLHSHSYTGNPLACRAALATLDLFKSTNAIETNKPKQQKINRHLKQFNELPHVAETRQTGMIAAVELVRDKQTKEPFHWQERRGLSVYQYGLKHGVLLRPLGNVIYFMPPYVISDDELELMMNVAYQGIIEATKS